MPVFDYNYNSNLRKLLSRSTKHDLSASYTATTRLETSEHSRTTRSKFKGIADFYVLFSILFYGGGGLGVGASREYYYTLVV